MTWILVTFVLFALFLGVTWFARSILPREAPSSKRVQDEEVISAGAAKIAQFVIVGLWAAVTFFFSFHPINAGHVGVVYQFGGIIGQVGEGPQFTTPWQDVRSESIRVQKKFFEKLDAFSSQTHDVYVAASLNYQVAPEAIQQLYRNVGPAYFEVLVTPRVNQNFKDETVKYQSVEIAPNRETIRQAVRDRLIRELAPYSITVVDLLIDNIAFNPAFQTSIENKLIATQDALREQERIKQREYEAEQAVETARGEGESIRVLAEKQAEANRLLAASLTPEVIQFAALQKLADNVQIVLIPSGQGLIIDPSTLLGGEKK